MPDRRFGFALAALWLSSAAALAQSAIYPPGAAPLQVSATGTTAITAATLTPSPTASISLCGFNIRASATAAASGLATVTGISGGTLSYQQFVSPVASGVSDLTQVFNPCIPGVYGTAIVVNSIAAGTAGVTSVTAWGYSR